jgi:hypothetical protein
MSFRAGDTYRAEGADKAMQKFMAHAGLGARYQPDIEALRAAPTRIVVAGGATSKGQLANRTAVALAGQLGTTVVDFPGDHGGFLAVPEQCGRHPYRHQEHFSIQARRSATEPP